ncbi:MAG TPA: helix-turn-helix transcriptional regulator [Solirubrobacteraceae bacterium]|jgi:transcriptional regulator with XRE-family HTH domain
MDIADVVTRARRDANITQAELARRARTSQPAVAAYEAGVRVPSIETLERLVSACECDLELSVRPRVRRGAESLRGIAQIMREDLSKGEEDDALRLVFGFADDFRGSSRPGRIALLNDNPPPTGDPRFDAALAGTAEFFAREAEIVPPSWVDGPNRFVEPWWFVSSRPAFDAYVLQHTPAVFARHGVFIAREVFDRA